MKIFVAGATGVIGRFLLPMLIRDGHTVFAMIRDESQVEAIKKVGAIPIIAGREVLQIIKHVKSMDGYLYILHGLMSM
jgi:nucleoside-diphosphate-sugar epimerase